MTGQFECREGIGQISRRQPCNAGQFLDIRRTGSHGIEDTRCRRILVRRIAFRLIDGRFGFSFRDAGTEYFGRRRDL